MGVAVCGQGLGVRENEQAKDRAGWWWREAGLWKVSFCPRRTKFCWWGQGSPQASGGDRTLLWESKADVREERMQIYAELTPLEMALGFPRGAAKCTGL